MRRPEPKAIGHPGRGEQIVAGELHLGGVTLTGDFFAADLPPTVAAELHGFGWLDDLAAVGTPKARAQTFACRNAACAAPRSTTTTTSPASYNRWRMRFCRLSTTIFQP